MPTTTLPGIVRYDENTQVDALHQLFNTGFISMEALVLALRKMGSNAVANATERNALMPSPTQGDRVFRLDLGYTEAYFTVYNAATNPGGAAAAGWYPLDATIYGKVARASNMTSLGSGDYVTLFESGTQTLPGMINTANRARLILPVIGLWEVEGFATTSGLDGGVLRSEVRINGVRQSDLRDNVSGIGGVTDPFVRPRGIVVVTNTTSYAELVFSQGGKSSATLLGEVTLSARYLGPNRIV